jgi:hypothetical protein
VAVDLLRSLSYHESALVQYCTDPNREDCPCLREFLIDYPPSQGLSLTNVESHCAPVTQLRNVVAAWNAGKQLPLRVARQYSTAVAYCQSIFSALEKAEEC